VRQEDCPVATVKPFIFIQMSIILLPVFFSSVCKFEYVLAVVFILNDFLRRLKKTKKQRTSFCIVDQSCFPNELIEWMKMGRLYTELSKCKKAFVIILVSDSGQSVTVALKRPELPSLCLFYSYKLSFTRSIPNLV